MLFKMRIFVSNENEINYVDLLDFVFKKNDTTYKLFIPPVGTENIYFVISVSSAET